MNEDNASRFVPAYRVVLDNANRITVNSDDGERVIDFMGRQAEDTTRRNYSVMLPDKTLAIMNLGDGPAYGMPPYGEGTNATTTIVLAHIAYVEKLSRFEVAQLLKKPYVESERFIEVRVVFNRIPDGPGHEAEFIEVERVDTGASIGTDLGVAFVTARLDSNFPTPCAHLGPFYVKAPVGAMNRTQ